MTNQKQTKLKIKQGFITQRIGGKTTIFSGEDSILFTLNETAAYIYNGLKLNWPKNKIILGLTKKYNVSPQEASRDIDELLSLLLDKKILFKE